MFFLENSYKKKFASLCPKLFRRFRSQIYSYSRDPTLSYKIRFLRESVCYFQRAENKALTEIAFQMEIRQINIEDTLIKQNDKVKELLIVFDGELELSLTSQEDTFLFEYLCEGSSYGQYSLLKSQDERSFVGTSSFQVKASRWSQVISIDH